MHGIIYPQYFGKDSFIDMHSIKVKECGVVRSIETRGVKMFADCCNAVCSSDKSKSMKSQPQGDG